MLEVAYIFFGLLTISLHQVYGDWSGTGQLICYSHYESDATFPPGASNEAPANVVCRPVEWKYPDVDLGPEAMFFHPESGGDFEIWAWDYHDGQASIPWAECDGNFWYKTDDMGAGFCTPNKNGDVAACRIAHCEGTITCHGC
jgi:hypothetical protein